MWDLMEPGESDDVVRLELAASFKFLKLLRPCIRALIEMVDNLSAEQLQTLAYNLELATYEACTNVVEHAYVGAGGRIGLFFSLNQDRTRFTIGICDTGRIFDLSSSDIHLPEADQTRGYGLYLVHQLMDEVHYWSADGSNHWRLLKQL